MIKLNNRIYYYWDRTPRPGTALANQENATEPPPVAIISPISKFTVEATKAIKILLRERPGASDEHINEWAADLGIEKDIAKEYVKQLRGENNGSAGAERESLVLSEIMRPNVSDTPPHTPSCEPGSPQSEVSTVVPHNRDASPITLSPRNGLYASSSTATSPLVGTCNQRELFREPPTASNVLASSPEDSTGHAGDDDTVHRLDTKVFLTHPSSTSTGPMDAEGFNRRSWLSVSPSDTKAYDISRAAANLDVPRLPSFAEVPDDAHRPQQLELATKFQPYRDRMDSLLLRIRAARRAQMRRSGCPLT
ncbi:hypothetical protein BD410DRAFT_190011 [Rickenella mellea]|uniref:Uncharacterized protein n=1 Tax=Rickenella mellea TaxID=50990 RepID=A0A4Y7Q8F8_9AGAM|nr:hypothetical protein BD410DRAFT_190011 [Rickenella mellea]